MINKNNFHFLCWLMASSICVMSIMISSSTLAQDAPNDIFAADDDDLNIGGDIFTDFNEDVENTQLVEDERFYRYGRFFSFNISLGLTSFDGNRGLAYENSPPSFGMSYTFFKDFQTAYGLGLEYSKHSMFLKDAVQGFPDTNCVGPSGPNTVACPPGQIDISMLRVFFGYRHYIDTANLGTAITYSNPYLIGRIEYWYQTNEYIDQTQLPKDSGGGFGLGVGFGLEFPLKLKETYLGLEFLIHTVNYPDTNSQTYAPIAADGYGFEDLKGNAFSTMVSYIFNW